MFPVTTSRRLKCPALARNRRVNPLAIMQVQNGGGRNRGPRFGLFAVKGRGDEHAHAHHAGVGDFKANFCGAKAGIENRQDVIDPAFEDAVGIGVQVDIRVFADAHCVEIIFVNVADDPDIREVGDGEGIRGTRSPVRPTRW